MSTVSENGCLLGAVLLSPPSLKIDFQGWLTYSTVLKNGCSTNKFISFPNEIE